MKGDNMYTKQQIEKMDTDILIELRDFDCDSFCFIKYCEGCPYTNKVNPITGGLCDSNLANEELKMRGIENGY